LSESSNALGNIKLLAVIINVEKPAATRLKTYQQWLKLTLKDTKENAVKLFAVNGKHIIN
jgi:hypothetical protein